MRRMKIQVVGKDNGLGLSQDVQVLREALEPRHEIHFTDWQQPRRVEARHFDLNIFCELINPVFFGQARANYGLLNPEWTSREVGRHAARLDLILCKTRDAMEAFSKTAPTHYTGFTSIDKWDAEVERRHAFLHVAGGSSAKGTNELVQAFGRTGVPLTIIGTTHVPKMLPENITHHQRVSPDALSYLMNQHAIHVCPSSYEGFGHYINEARSVGAMILTTNAAPMNELCTPEFSFGVGYDRMTPQGMAIHKHVNVDQLAEAVEVTAKMDPALVIRLGAKARMAYLKGKEEFHQAMKDLLP